jgi:hypothetical protein
VEFEIWERGFVYVSFSPAKLCANQRQQINTQLGYSHFISRLHLYFFDHFGCIKKLSLLAPELGPIGLHLAYFLRPSSMPLLQKLRLENVFIDPQLVHFLVSHSTTLEQIHLKNCMGGLNGLSFDGIYWETLFTALARARPERLIDVELEPLQVPFSWDEKWENKISENESDDVIRARSILEKESNRRAFPYGYVDDKYGNCSADEDVNVEAFLAGRDQKGYDELMAIVQKNAEDVKGLEAT